MHFTKVHSQWNLRLSQYSMLWLTETKSKRKYDAVAFLALICHPSLWCCRVSVNLIL